MLTLDRHDAVFVLDLGDSENRLHPHWVSSVDALLDEVENGDDPTALVTTASALIQSRLTPRTAHLAMVTARRLGGDEAYAHRIVDEALPEPELREKAIALATTHVTEAGPALQPARPGCTPPSSRP